MYRTALLSTAALVSLASQANALDLLPSSYDWSGAYMGINAGIVSDSSSFDSAIKNFDGNYDTLKGTIDGDKSSLMGGGFVGYNLQFNHVLIGAEADLNYLGCSDNKSKLEDYDLYSATRTTTFDASWFGTLRARAGIVAGGFLIYGTAGLATGNMQATATVEAIDLATGDVAKWKGSTEATNFGWTAGGGLEYGISNVSFGLEYLFVDLGTAEWSGNLSSTPSDVIDGSDVSGSTHYQFSLTRATAKLHF